MKLAIRLALLLAGAVGAGMFLTACGSADMGTMSVSPTTVVATVPTTLTFTYTAPATPSTGHVQVVIPKGWSPPTHVNPTVRGWVDPVPTTCTSASLSSITGSGSGPWTVTLSVVCPAGGQFTLGYGGPGSAAVRSPEIVGSATFATSAEFGNATTFTALASSPEVAVTTNVKSVDVSMNPGSILWSGETATVAIQALDVNDVGVARAPTLTTTGGLTLGPVVYEGSGIYTATVTPPASTTPATATVTARDLGVSGSSNLTLDPITSLSLVSPISPMPAGTTQTVIVRATDQNGQPVVGATVGVTATGVSPAASIMTDQHNGRYTVSVQANTTVGSGQVTVTAGTVSLTTDLQVVAGPAAGLDCWNSAFDLPANGTTEVTFTADARDQYGNLATVAAVAFSSSGPLTISVATLGSDGDFHATATASSPAGPETVTGTSGALTCSFEMATVDPVPASVGMSFAPSAIASDGSSTTVAHIGVANAEGQGLIDQPVVVTDDHGLPVGPVTGDNLGDYTATIGPTSAAGVVHVTASDGAVAGAAPLTVAAPTLAWHSAGAMGTARTHHTATLLPDGDVLVVGGDRAPVDNVTGTQNGSLALASAELYHPASNTWSSAGSLTTARANQTATLLNNGKVLVAGGYGVSGALASTELYDPATNTWAPGPRMVQGRWGQTATLLADGRVFVYGGANTNSATGDIGTTEIYDPVADTWTAAAPFESVIFQSATLMTNGEVYIAGGNELSPGPWLYDPVSNQWFVVLSPALLPTSVVAAQLDSGQVLIEGRGQALLGTPTRGFAAGLTQVAAPLDSSSDGTLTRLPTGQLLAITGRAPPTAGPPAETVQTSTERYDPVANTWVPDAPLHTARADMTATLLPDGTMLVVGGDGASSLLASAERSSPIGPVHNTITATADHTALPADGTSSSTITIRVADGHGAPLAGQTLSLSLSGTGTIGTVTDHGDGSYTAAYTTSTTSGPATVTIVDGLVTRQMGFYATPGLPAAINLVADPATVHVSGTNPPRVDLQLEVVDAFGNPTEGGTLTMTTSGDATIAAGASEALEGYYDGTYLPSRTLGDQTVTVTTTYRGVDVSATVVVHQVA
jgi:Invasin, domain 3/Galactose oxidase, central domain